MSLDLRKLEKVRELADGAFQARCPACAETGQDRSGEHLRIYSNGKFGCCVHAGDREHRRRIFALAGERKRQSIQVQVKVSSAAAGEVKRLSFGKIKLAADQPTDGPDGVNEIETQTEIGLTLRTGETKSDSESFKNDDEQSRTGRTGKTESSGELCTSPDSLRTLRTPQYSYTLANKDSVQEEESTCATYKEFSTPVRCVREQEIAGVVLQPAEKPEILPYITAGDLVIPFASPERYHWWKEGQSVEQTRREALERFHAEQRKDSDVDY
jgi:hypothetical protein